MSYVLGGQSSPAGLTGATSAARFAGATTGGAPASGTFVVGDFVVDQLGTFWVCITAGSPGTWTTFPQTFSSGTQGSEGTANEICTPGYYGLKAWNYDPLLATTAVNPGTGVVYAIRVFCPVAFTLTKLAYVVQTAISGGTAALTTTNTNATDLTTLVGAQSLTVAANTFAASGTFTTPTTIPVGTAVVSYGGGGGTTTLTSCATQYSSTGTMGAGATITQSVNTLGVFNNAGTTLLGTLADQVTNWGTAGWGGAAAATQTLTTPNGVSAAITAGSYVWVVPMSNFATNGVRLAGPTSTGILTTGPAINGTLSVSTLRLGRVGTGQTSFPATITPGSFTNTGLLSPGLAWFGLA